MEKASAKQRKMRRKNKMNEKKTQHNKRINITHTHTHTSFASRFLPFILRHFSFYKTNANEIFNTLVK